ncbi:MAG: DegT/DnrJ/EryC1/StrS family aminotransferase [Parachlamydiales bacterium]|jgi:dTDP-4-amino-4,6-dideoxygalactose transaminase
MDKHHFKWPLLGKRAEAAVLKQLHAGISIYNRSGIIETLEERLAKYHGVKHALLTCTGTAAIHSMYVAAGLQPGDEVICPAYNFYASVTPLFFTQAVPVLVDADKTGNINTKLIEEKITPRTRAICVTHMWGQPCDMDAISAIAQKHRLMLFEDGSHAHGATFGKKRIGAFGTAAAFSLQGQKTLTGGEGGFLLTNDDNLFYRALLFGHYNKRCKTEIPQNHPLSRYAVTGMGLKLRIHPLAAALANEQMNHLDRIIQKRQSMALRMAEELQKIPCITPILPSENKTSSWYAFTMLYHPEKLSNLPISAFRKRLHKENCPEIDQPGSTCALNLHPLFQSPAELFPFYRNIKYSIGAFPVAEYLSAHIIKMPVWHRSNDLPVVKHYLKAFKTLYQKTRHV